ncbi:hypothetical protein [Hoeflea poritis]|uniref:Uncharacterized protein n=1 Tax=Hoeflea poritis TaxID=2993659 RepID=A0ABT4VTG0_9HYPH|nr:hypothetical protein [Hoeflea poritis]MDA4848001.1 hypothetical protein [Hoeflea poritis]
MSEGFFSYELTKEIHPHGDDDPVRFYRRSRLKPQVQRRFSENDIREMLNLAGTSLATVFPVRYWPAYNRFTSSIRYRHLRNKKFEGFAKSMRAVFSIDDESKIESLFRSHLEILQRRKQMFMIDMLARNKNPKIDFVGAEILREALERGNGAIVWASQLSFQSLAGKRALWEQGFEPLQVSADHHGFSDTAFGNTVINAPLRRAENRYLKQRVVFERDHGAAVTRKIIGLLDQGKLVVLTNNVYAGNMFVEMRFGQSGHISVPTAPLSIVARRNTPFFSMSTLETEPFKRMQAVVEKIEAGGKTKSTGTSEKRDYNKMASLALVARDHMFTQCRRAPDQHLIPEHLAGGRFE